MTLYIMCGVPGVGKSYFAKKKLMEGPGWRYISRDEIRYSILKEGEDYFSHENEVFEKFITAIENAFNDDGIFNVIADATHLNWASRNKLIRNLGKSLNKVNVIPIMITADPITVNEQNEQRTGPACVDRSVIRRMTASLTDPKTDPYNYTAIMYVDNSKHDLVEKPKFMYHKNDIKMKEIPIKEALRK